MTETNRPNDKAEETEWAEPIFGDDDVEEPVFGEALDDEPSFDEEELDLEAIQSVAARSYGDGEIDEEPVFADDDDAPPESTLAVGMESVARDKESGGAVSLPQKPKRSTAQRSDEPDAVDAVHWPGSEVMAQPRNRRLGRTGPFWLVAAGMAAVLLFAIWFGFFRTDGDGSPDLTPVAAGVSGSITLPTDAELMELTPEAPAPIPVPLLTVSQPVVVGNTGGQGIRLRSQPSTSGQTLAIYQDGDKFIVLAPDGDYDSYPVEADNYRWYRIQVAGNPEENLTGWAAGDFLVAVEE